MVNKPEEYTDKVERKAAGTKAPKLSWKAVYEGKQKRRATAAAKPVMEMSAFWAKHPLVLPAKNMERAQHFACATRIFHNGSLISGGRWYGGWTNLKSHKRLHMRIDDEPICEIDLNASQPTLFSALPGIRMNVGGDTWTDVYASVVERLDAHEEPKLLRMMVKQVLVEMLEMGARIFIRHARGYTLTELGEDVLRVAQKTEEIIEDLAGRVHGGKAALEGELKLTILAGFAELLMKPISDFRAENPNCIVNLDASENLAKLEYGEAHIALRAGPKPDHPDYVVSNFAQISFNLYAHDSYIQRFGMPKDASDFGGHQFVLPPSFGGNLSVRQWIKNIVRPDMIALSSQHADVNFKAIFAGAGMGIIEDHKAKRYEGFHRVLTTNEEWSAPIWLVTHVDLHLTEKVRAMLRCIKSARQEE